MTTPVDPRKRPRRRRPRGALVGFSFVLPNFIGFALLTLVPVVALFYLSLTSWNAFGTAKWKGLDNFTRLLGDKSFHTAFLNTMYYAVFHVPLTMAAALGLAVLLNSRLRGLGLFRTVAFLPYVTSIVTIAIAWNLLFSRETGPINQLIGMVGADFAPGWTTDKDWAMPAVIIVSVWRDMGYYMLLFLAGLQTIPKQLYEAATIDGANAWQRFRNVTLPGLRHTTFFVLVMLTISSFKVFDLILVLTDGGPGQSTLVLAQLIFQRGFEENQFGYASAISVVLFFLCLLVTIVQFAVNRRRDA